MNAKLLVNPQAILSALTSLSAAYGQGNTIDKVRFGVDLHPALRQAVDERAENFRMSRNQMLNIAIEWFLDRYLNGALPEHCLIDPNLLVTDTTQAPSPRTTTITSTGEVRSVLDDLASAEEFGSTPAAVVRSVLAYYFTACLTSPSAAVSARTP